MTYMQAVRPEMATGGRARKGDIDGALANESPSSRRMLSAILAAIGAALNLVLLVSESGLGAFSRALSRHRNCLTRAVQAHCATAGLLM